MGQTQSPSQQAPAALPAASLPSSPGGAPDQRSFPLLPSLPTLAEVGAPFPNPTEPIANAPGPDFGTFNLQQILARATSEIASFFASFVAGTFQILSYNSSRVIFLGSLIPAGYDRAAVLNNLLR
jgi:hypothetical protein